MVVAFQSAGAARQNSGAASASAPTARDGQHDFDFTIGTWRTHIKRLQHSPAGDKWIELNGDVIVRKVWGGKGELEEIEADGPHGHWEGLTLFLYNPDAHQWSENYANANDGILTVPLTGEFNDGRGEFYGQEQVNGKVVLVRGEWSDIAPDSHRYEISLSDDGGGTWKPDFIAMLTREGQARDETRVPYNPPVVEGQHAFDWQFGTWKIHMSRLLHPVTGSTTWTPLDGTVMVEKVFNGRANLAEIEAEGLSGHLQFLALRLFNPQSRQWSLSFASSNSGALGVPMFGEFKNGRGVFYDQEQFNGRTIWVRFVFDDVTGISGRDEQAFSDDGGKTWEINWVNTTARQGNRAGQEQ